MNKYIFKITICFLFLLGCDIKMNNLENENMIHAKIATSKGTILINLELHLTEEC